MSFQPTFPGLFSQSGGATPLQVELPLSEPLLPTEKQITYAHILAAKIGCAVPKEVARDRQALSGWIDAHKKTPTEGRFSNYPSSKQVAFAERIARLRRRSVPQECFRDKGLMSRWIDSNKP